MRKKIVLDYGSQGNIAKLLGCTSDMVSRSLNFKKDTELARKIRHVALTQFGGIEVGGTGYEKSI